MARPSGPTRLLKTSTVVLSVGRFIVAEEEWTPEQEKAMEEFVAKVNDHIRTLNLEKHGELLTPEQISAHCVFWLKILHENYPDLEPLVAIIMQHMILKVVPVTSDDEAEKLKKRMLN